ncbi:hypothetical protein [Rhodococcus phage RGL3]|uniref:Uncharacterized protein n=1 Tax=Rhodococcus phage RGL3 TaxID=2922221 RepID=G9FHL9_9CAUD|nr:hypothetical protein RoPhRGL3_gp27 [Rhodococcus phage RGL3]AEV52107.1 hypothetical protein [Rhodococcus phage RGL3]
MRMTATQIVQEIAAYEATILECRDAFRRKSAEGYPHSAQTYLQNVPLMEAEIERLRGLL